MIDMLRYLGICVGLGLAIILPVLGLMHIIMFIADIVKHPLSDEEAACIAKVIVFGVALIFAPLMPFIL